jgi:hypothetical protein
MKTSPKPTTTEGSEKLQLVIDTRQDLGKHLPYTHQDPSEPHTSFPPSEERHTERSSSRPRQGIREHSERPSKRHTSVTTIWFSRSSQGTTQKSHTWMWSIDADSLFNTVFQTCVLASLPVLSWGSPVPFQRLFTTPSKLHRGTHPGQPSQTRPDTPQSPHTQLPPPSQTPRVRPLRTPPAPSNSSPKNCQNGNPKTTKHHNTYPRLSHPPYIQRITPHSDKETSSRGRLSNHLKETKNGYHPRKRDVTTVPIPLKHTTDKIHITQHFSDYPTRLTTLTSLKVDADSLVRIHFPSRIDHNLKIETRLGGGRFESVKGREGCVNVVFWWFYYCRIKEGESQGKNTLELWYTLSR